MKYQANPVIVEAQIITNTGKGAATEITPDGGCLLHLQNGDTFHADKGMIARYIPKEGDYLVTQEDGYVYVNPKEVFERKYSPLKAA